VAEAVAARSPLVLPDFTTRQTLSRELSQRAQESTTVLCAPGEPSRVTRPRLRARKENVDESKPASGRTETTPHPAGSHSQQPLRFLSRGS
jgi:hypothetical protein